MGGSPNKLDKHFFFTSLNAKLLMKFCFVNIVKRGNLLLSIFDFIKKKYEKKKKYIKKSKIQEDTHE